MKNSWRLDLLLRALRSRRRATPEETEQIFELVTDEGYYEEISVRYGTAQVICIMLLAVFLAVSLITNTELLSADNLIYFAKDLTTSIATRETEARDTLVYASDEENQFTLYRDGLVALGQQKLTVFTATGREAHAHLLSYQTPRLATSGRYLLAYDLGGREFSLYNSFTRVKSLSADATIRGAAICNKGYYCIITDGLESASAVVLYNDSHRPVARYSLQEYTLCADIRDDGEQMVLVSVSADNGRMVTHLAIATPGASEWGSTWTIPDAYGVECHYTEDGNILLVATDALYLFSDTGEMLACERFSPNDVITFRAGAFGCVLLSRANAYDKATQVIAFDKDGQKVYNVTVQDEVLDVSFDGRSLALLTEEALTVYRDASVSDAMTLALRGTYHSLLLCEQDEFMLCGDAKAITVRPRNGE